MGKNKELDVIVKPPGDIRELDGYSGAYCKLCGSTLHIKTPEIKDWYSIKCPVCGFIVSLYCGKNFSHRNPLI